MRSIDTETKLYGIFGNPVKHSISPKIHNHIFNKLNYNARYLAFQPNNLSDAIKGVRELGISGLSVTIPFKVEIINYLDELDELAMYIQAVNTVINENGILKGYNTDGIGALESILDAGVDLNDKNVVILGNGGSTKAIVHTLLAKTSLKNIFVTGRNEHNVNNFIHSIDSNKLIPVLFSSQKYKEVILESSLIINTTSVGMVPNINQSLVPPEWINSNHAVFDIVYNPHDTKLICDAKSQQAKVIYGISMLINQAYEQAKLFTKMKINKAWLAESVQKIK